MARTTYDEADQARVYVVLAANDGNVKRTAREVSMPESTIRRWRSEWDRVGPPKLEEVEQATSEFLDDASEARGLALEVVVLKLKLLKENPKDVNVAQVTTLIGILTDKIDRAKGLDQGGRVDHFHHLPAPEELRALMGEYVAGSISAAERRAEEIVDVEFFQEQAALPAGK